MNVTMGAGHMVQFQTLSVWKTVETASFATVRRKGVIHSLWETEYVKLLAIAKLVAMTVKQIRRLQATVARAQQNALCI
jgi:hypothetical protein